MPARALPHGLMLLYLLLFSLFVISNPQYYWDIVPYIAASLQGHFADASALHQATYGLLEAQLHPSQFQFLISGNFAASIHADPGALASQLPLYQNKPLYVGALRFFNGLGINSLDSLLLLSLLPALGMLWILYLTLCRYCHPYKALFLVVVFAFAARLTDLTQGLVHNNLANFLLLAGSCLLIEKRRTDWAMFCFALAVLTRTENLIFVTFTQALLCWRYAFYQGNRTIREWLVRLGGLALYPMLYLGIATSYDQSWWRLFYHSLVQSQTLIENFSVPFSWSVYSQVLGEAVMQLFASGVYLVTVMPLFLLMLLLTIPLSGYRDFISSRHRSHAFVSYTDIGIITLLVMLVYLLLFPLVPAWDRFFTHFYALALIGAARRLRGCKPGLGYEFKPVTPPGQ